MSSQASAPAPPTGDDDSIEERQAAPVKRRRNLPGTPDPDAEVIALSPKTLMATNRFLCEVCGKGFQRDQNLQLHRRGHNLPWKLKQRDGQEIKRRVYVCPEVSCVHHDPLRALGDLTGIKKHFSRKHGEKKWKCEKCSKRYAVQSDWKAHQKVCGTREYRCDCGTLFPRRDSFITHRAFCDALAQENARVSAHRQVEIPKTSAAGESSAMQASTSPCRQATSEIPISEILEPPGRDTWEANSAFNESKVSIGLQDGPPLMPSKPMTGPGLSLSLGTGLGPGPPCLSELMLGSLSQTMAMSSNQMNKLVSANPDWDKRSQWPSPLGSASIFTSMLTASSSTLESQAFGHGMAGLSIGMNPLLENSTIPQFATHLNNGFFSTSHRQQHSGGAQLPATTLLQKAALMGVTKSTSFLFRKPGDLTSSPPGESRQHETWAGVTSSSSASWCSVSMPLAAESLHLNRGPGYRAINPAGFSPASYDGQEGAQRFKDQGGAPRQEDISPAARSSSNMTRVLSLGCSREPERVERFGQLRLNSQNAVVSAELEGSQREETSETNRMTLDFLGVGDHSPLQ